jgi:lipopolysaccharide transport system permease protein
VTGDTQAVDTTLRSPQAPDTDAQTRDAPRLVIEPSRGWADLGLDELWRYRELLFFLVWREVKGRYRQMAFGPLWIIMAPLLQMVIFSTIFGNFARLPSEGVPYPIFTYVALLPWQFFANATRKSSQSLVQQKNVIAKVYFPRLVIPLSAVLSSLVDFLASFVVLAGMMLVYRVDLTWRIAALPLLILLTAATSLAIGLWLAGLAVKFHDVAIGVGFFLQVWRYVTPVVYSATLVPDRWQALYRLNPMASVVQGFRWALLGTGQAPDWTTAVAAAVVLLLLFTGALSFRRTERTIVDMI